MKMGVANHGVSVDLIQLPDRLKSPRKNLIWRLSSKAKSCMTMIKRILSPPAVLTEFSSLR